MLSSYISICWSSTPRNGGRVVLALGSSGSRSRGEAPGEPVRTGAEASFETTIEMHFEAPYLARSQERGLLSNPRV